MEDKNNFILKKGKQKKQDVLRAVNNIYFKKSNFFKIKKKNLPNASFGVKGTGKLSTLLKILLFLSNLTKALYNFIGRI